jgi:hypothetical protein
MPPPPAGASPPPLWGGEDHLRELFGDRVELEKVEREALEVTAFQTPDEFAEHFKGFYGPTIAARANAEKEGRTEELNQALSEFFAERNLGSGDDARFEMEYLLTVGRVR